MADNEFEAFRIIFIPLFSMAFYSQFLPQWPILEFIFYAIPQLLAISFPDYTGIIYLALIVPLVVIPKKYTRIYDSRTDLIDRSRMKIIFIVCIAFLLLNFKDQKSTEQSKVNLLEIALESFIFNAGIVSHKTTKKRKIFNILKSLMLGIIKSLSTARSLEKSEYVNIFFILCIINVLAMFGLPDNSFFIGLVLLSFYQVLLYLGLETFLTVKSLRPNILEYLKGFVYIIPLYSLYIMASAVGKAISNKENKNYLLYYCTISAPCFLFFRHFTAPSSTIHNAPFCMVVFILNSSDLLLFEFLSNYFGIGQLVLTEFASRVVFHVFVTVNIFIPIAMRIGYFDCSSVVKIWGKVIIYLFIIFYTMYKVKVLAIDSYWAKIQNNTADFF